MHTYIVLNVRKVFTYNFVFFQLHVNNDVLVFKRQDNMDINFLNYV